MTTFRTITQDPRQWIAQNMWWLRWPAVIYVLLVVVGLAFVLNGRNAQLFLLLLIAVPAALMGAYVLLRWMAIGFILLPLANMLVPISIGTGSESSLSATVMLIMGMTGLWLFDMINRQRHIWVHRSRPILPLMLMLVAAIISFLAGQLPWFAISGAPLTAQIGGLAIFVISVCAFLLAAHHIPNIRWLEWMTWAFVIVGTAYLAARFAFPVYRQGVRLFLYSSNSSQFWLWFVVITFSQGWINHKLPWYIRGALLALCAGALYSVGVIEFDWKSGWIPAVIGIAAVAALYSWRMAVLMGITGLFTLPIAISRVVATDEYSYGTRVDAWVILGEIIKVNPLLGLGPANYYWYTPLYAIRGYNVEFNSHNQYIDLLAQVGIVGTAFILWFFVEVGWLGWKLLKAVPEGFAKAYAYGALGGLIALVISGMLGDWILPFVYNVGIVGMRSSILGWVFLGALVAMEQMYLKEPVISEQ